MVDVGTPCYSLACKYALINIFRFLDRGYVLSLCMFQGIKASGELAAFVTPPKIVIDVQNSSGEATADSSVGATSVEPPFRGGRIRSSAVNANAAVVAAIASSSSRQPRKRPRKDPSGTSPIKRAKRTSANSDVIIVSEDSANPIVISEEATAVHVENILHQ